MAQAQQPSEVVRKVSAEEPVNEAGRRLLVAGDSFGGAEPKALIEIAGEQWGIMFQQRAHRISDSLADVVWRLRFMERVMGIEPTLFAWEAKVLPLNYTREVADYRDSTGQLWIYFGSKCRGECKPSLRLGAS